jgi:beta-N-acetylhexosaminidase
MKSLNTTLLLILVILSLWAEFSFGVATDIGQILMVGFNEAEATPDLIKHLKKIKPGAIILFRRNIQSPRQLEALLQTLKRELNPVLSTPILFAIDQEGGSVYRIPTSPRIPSPAALGKSNDPVIVEQYGFAIGRVLRRNGISMNLAPVLDLDIPSDENFIGSRSFGTNPALVAQMGYLFAKGLAAAGVVPTGKHFPGLGAVMSDPHEVTPTSDLNWQTDWNRELLPFREFSRLTPSALMLSHVIYPKLDLQRLPASVSPYIIKRVLRDSLKYQGLVITDDLLMKGITSKFNPSEAALASLNSGADLVMLSWSRKDQLKVYEDLKVASQTNRLDGLELNEKMKRLSQIKNLIGVNDKAASSPISWESEEIKALNKKLLETNLARDQHLYKKVSHKKQFYFVNLNPSWPQIFAKKFPEAKMSHFTDFSDYKKLSVEQKEQGLLVFGIHQRKSVEQIIQLSPQEKTNTVLVVINDVSIENPENYFSVFSPLWTFDGIANSVLKYL